MSLHHLVHLVLRLCAHGHYPHLLGLELPKQLIELLEVLLQVNINTNRNVKGVGLQNLIIIMSVLSLSRILPLH